MSRLMNYTSSQKRQVVKNDKGEELAKDINCLGCKYVIDSSCKGKPRHVKECLNYEERKKE